MGMIQTDPSKSGVTQMEGTSVDTVNRERGAERQWMRKRGGGGGGERHRHVEREREREREKEECVWQIVRDRGRVKEEGEVKVDGQ